MIRERTWLSYDLFGNVDKYLHMYIYINIFIYNDKVKIF